MDRPLTDATYVEDFLATAISLLRDIDRTTILALVSELVELRERRGRLFLVGSGGGASHASHAACDFRKLAAIEAYSPSDNVSELTARINDEGWETSYVGWLKTSRMTKDDLLFVISVGGGDSRRNISPNIVACIDHARAIGSRVVGVVGRDGGYTRRHADVCVLIPQPTSQGETPHTEGLQAVIWHLLVSHPALQCMPAKWEAVGA